MILFEVDAQGYVKSTPSLIPQGMALSDIAIITESDYELVTLRLIPPSGKYIPDVVCTPVKTQDKSATLWQAILPAEAAAMHGVLTYQIFRRNAQGRVIPTQEGTLTVQRGVISDMPESVEHLGTYSIDALYILLATIHAKDEDHDRGIDKNASDIAGLRLGLNSVDAAVKSNTFRIETLEKRGGGTSLTRLTETGDGGNVSIEVKNNTLYRVSGYDTVTITVPEGDYSAHLFVEFPANAEAVGFVLPKDMEVSGNDPSTAAKGERWEVSLDSMGGAIFLRKAVLP